MKAIEELRAEHEGILVILDVLVRISQKIKAGGSVPVEHLKQIVEFLQVFADKCHHGKEEGILFPAMEAGGVPKAGGPLGVMLSEHDMGRSLIGEMKSLIQAYEAGDKGALTTLTDPALQYVDLLKSHIRKENEVLFAMAEPAIPEAKQKDLAERFEKFEDEVIGRGRHEAFHAMIENLSTIYRH